MLVAVCVLSLLSSCLGDGVTSPVVGDVGSGCAIGGLGDGLDGGCILRSAASAVPGAGASVAGAAAVVVVAAVSIAPPRCSSAIPISSIALTAMLCPDGVWPSVCVSGIVAMVTGDVSGCVVLDLVAVFCSGGCC